MGKCSNDSDTEKRRNKRSHHSNNRRRSSSSDSSNSRSRHKKITKTSRRQRGRSRSSSRYYRSRRSRSKSGSYHRTRKSTTSKDYHRRRSYSRDRHRSRRSRSKDYIKEYVSRKSQSSSSSSTYSSSSSTSSDSSKVKVKGSRPIEHDGNIKEKNDSSQDFDIPTMDAQVLEELNADSFAQKAFSSKNKKLPNTIVIDLKKQTIKVPQVEPVEPDSIFHHNLFLSEEARTEKWVKELYMYRQKALQQGTKNT